MKKEDVPQFKRFEPIANAEELARLKHEVLIDKDIESLAEQPHGLDFKVDHFRDVNDVHNRAVEWREEVSPEGEVYEIAKLAPNGEYDMSLRPILKETPSELDYELVLLPRSSLLRAGIEGWISGYNQEGIEKGEKALGTKPTSSEFKQMRYGSFRIKILNPNGVEIERDTPVVQILFIKKRTEGEESVSEKDFEPLHLGEILSFNEQSPHLAKNKARQNLNVTQPMELSDGKYLLRQGVPYLLRSQESVALSSDEIGTTQGSLGETEFANGSALVDAGYEGKLI